MVREQDFTTTDLESADCMWQSSMSVKSKSNTIKCMECICDGLKWWSLALNSTLNKHYNDVFATYLKETWVMVECERARYKTNSSVLFYDLIWCRIASTIAHPYWPAPCSMQWSTDQTFSFIMGCFFFLSLYTNFKKRKTCTFLLG